MQSVTEQQVSVLASQLNSSQQRRPPPWHAVATALHGPARPETTRNVGKSEHAETTTTARVNIAPASARGCVRVAFWKATMGSVGEGASVGRMRAESVSDSCHFSAAGRRISPSNPRATDTSGRVARSCARDCTPCATSVHTCAHECTRCPAHGGDPHVRRRREPEREALSIHLFVGGGDPARQRAASPLSSSRAIAHLDDATTGAPCQGTLGLYCYCERFPLEETGRRRARLRRRSLVVRPSRASS